MKKFDVTVTWTVQLTEEDIDDIMCAALEGGITGWCGEAEVVGEYLHEWAHEQISAGGTLRLHDAESSDSWELTLEKFLNGFQLWLKQGGAEYIVDDRIDIDHLDADDADSIVQLALFGEVVFG